MPLTNFHPAVARWFSQAFDTPTPCQTAAWPAIQAGKHTLIAAPTGSGKTLAAFLAAVDQLIRQGLAGQLGDTTQVVYISPLKALSNDIERNLQWPLAGIREQLQQLNLPDVAIRALARTGDTPQSQRVAMAKHPPHILVTTPESLYLLLTSDSGRHMLTTTRSVIIDEIHAVAGTKRGSHLVLSLERLAALVQPHRLTRIGLSATQKPIAEVARFLVGSKNEGPDDPTDTGGNCVIIDIGHSRERDLALELPGAPLEAVMSGEVWEQVYDKLAQLIETHRTTLVFVNTRRLAERATRHLSERLGKEHVTSHHGSLAKEQRLAAEQKLKAGELKALVATASLELGIDIGAVDLVCQLGSPRAIATFLQRVGRSGHAVGGTPKGRLFPLSRDELVECAALLDAVARGELDQLHIPPQPLDVLAQQIVAEVACREWDEDALYATFQRAYPYRHLSHQEFTRVVLMLAEGYSTRRGRHSAYLHRDAVNKRLRARKGTRLTALTCGGAIPDNADYQVLLEPADLVIGTLHEDFAIESMAGDIFQLGNASYRILKIEAGKVRVADAHGTPPTIPFWIGEAPARTDELSAAVSRLRTAIDVHLGSQINTATLAATTQWLSDTLRLSPMAAEQITTYLAAAKGVLGLIPSQTQLVLERFFDETGGMQLIIHSPYGGRINRAWGLSLRKRFCRKFNFELQAAATEDAIVLSLGETHSFPLAEVGHYLHSSTVREVLIQALLAAPLFTARWRWNATIALAIKRFRGGRKNPAPWQRMDAEDLMAVIFPDQIACAENLAGDREVPDHPLVKQTIDDSLHQAMDIDGLITLLTALEQGKIHLISRDLPHPSPLAQEILNAKPYAFLDDAPLEERRTQAVLGRRWLDPTQAADFGKLDAAAIHQVQQEAWPTVDNADELHDALMLLGMITAQEGQHAGWQPHFERLIAAQRGTCLRVMPDIAQPEFSLTLWVAAESLPLLCALYPAALLSPPITAPAEFAARSWHAEQALVELLRGRLQGLGPVTATTLALSLGITTIAIDTALLVLESEGFALRGQFTPDSHELEWCERRLLARIHRYTIKTLRAAIEPLTAADFMRFLCDWQGLTRDPRLEGPAALAAIVEQLEGFEAAATAWEKDILPSRLQAYDPQWLDNLCLTGRALWLRLTPPKTAANKDSYAAPVRSTPITLLTRQHFMHWRNLTTVKQTREPATLSAKAQAVAQYLSHHGASFFDAILVGAGQLKSPTEAALGELVAWGLVNADSFSGLRSLLKPAHRRQILRGRRHRTPLFGIEDAGRWTLLDTSGDSGTTVPQSALNPASVEYIALLLLKRYGVVFKRILEREAACLPPWYELLRVYRRLEARGEIRGGRFVAGFSGEQYALPEAVSALRATRNQAKTGRLLSISAADPLNLVGILTAGARVPALAGNRVLYQDGIPIAVHIANTIQFLVTLEPQLEQEARNALLRKNIGPALRVYLN